RRGRVPEPAHGHRGRRGGAAGHHGEAAAGLEGPLVGEEATGSHGGWETGAGAGQLYAAELMALRLREGGMEPRVPDQSHRQEPLPSIRSLALVRVLVPVEQAPAARRLLAEPVGLPEDAEEPPGPPQD